MREIKFKAWTGEKMINSFMYNFTTPEGWQWFHRDYHQGVREIMQFTGLLDKNGKEIYEGDVLLGLKEKVYVEYCDGAYELINQAGGFVGHLCFIYNEEIEVIGNIYENSELLTNAT